MKQANIFVVDFPLLDTRSKDKDLTGIFIADLVLQILSYVAQTEREMIRQRQAEGIACAKQKGIKFGRPKKEIPKDFYRTYEQFKRGEITAKQALEQSGMCKSIFYRKIKEFDAEKRRVPKGELFGSKKLPSNFI